jgi:protein SCO1/2/putative membrane protein
MKRLLLFLVCLTPANPVRAEAIGAVGEFALTERNGKTVTHDDLRGKVWVASFILTTCPDGKCPQITQTMQRLQKELKDVPDLRLVTITVDPQHDDPEALNEYADKFGADPERWLFLTGGEDQVARLLHEGFKVSGGSGGADHSTKLVVVDQKGNIQGYYQGLPDPYDEEPEKTLETNLRRLKIKVRNLSGAFDFPAINAGLNAVAGVLLLLGYIAIRQKYTKFHIACMLSALVVSAVFLASYLYYHIAVRGGVSTRFSDQAPGAPVWMAYTYYAILFSHIILAALVVPMALITAWKGLRNQLDRHVRLARWTFPIWLYVSVTGVAVYWMLYRLYAEG